jgi:hypothetical protein
VRFLHEIRRLRTLLVAASLNYRRGIECSAGNAHGSPTQVTAARRPDPAGSHRSGRRPAQNFSPRAYAPRSCRNAASTEGLNFSVSSAFDKRCAGGGGAAGAGLQDRTSYRLVVGDLPARFDGRLVPAHLEEFAQSFVPGAGDELHPLGQRCERVGATVAAAVLELVERPIDMGDHRAGP